MTRRQLSLTVTGQVRKCCAAFCLRDRLADGVRVAIVIGSAANCLVTLVKDDARASGSKSARPYIWHLIVLILLMVPSTLPGL